MRIPQTNQQRIKAGLHLVQAALVVIAGILAVAILTENGAPSGRVGYVLALVNSQ